MGEVDKMVNISSIQGMQRRKMIFISVISYHLLTICINYHEKNSVGLLQSLVKSLIIDLYINQRSMLYPTPEKLNGTDLSQYLWCRCSFFQIDWGAMRVNIVQGMYHHNPKEVAFLFRFTHLFPDMGAGLSPTLGVQPIIGGSAHHGRGDSGSPKDI